MDASEARQQLEGIVATLGAIQAFGKSDAGAPANAPWLTGTVLLHLEDAAGSVADAMGEIADAEELGDDDRRARARDDDARRGGRRPR
jgi:hypothetical protein